MWSFFSRDQLKSFPYEIGEKVSDDDDYSVWTLHVGKSKTNDQPVSVFCFNVAENSDICKQTSLGAIKRLRTLRHPNVLTFIDSLETDKFIYMVTEPVKPLSIHLKNFEGNHDFETSWGLHQIAKGLGFLINSVNLIHNNVCMASMFVNPAGEWKLGGVDYMYPASGEGSNLPPLKPLPQLEKYDPPEKNAARAKKSHKWSVDMWGLGCLIWEAYNGRLSRSSSLKVVNKIPKNLLKNYVALVTANPLSRPNPDIFIENCRANNSFMANHFVTTNLFLDEVQIKDEKEQIKFFEDLTEHLDEFPPAYSKYKILPKLLNVYQYGNVKTSVLAPLFKLGKLLGEEEYQEKIVPHVVTLFSSTDRATRIYLLRQLPIFAEHLKPKVVNSQVFPNMVTGFMDTNPAIREQTVKGMLLLAPKLNDTNLNTELMKHFARLQTRDDQGPIRTNTTVCLGKVTPHLSPIVRQRVITSAFSRAMKDPFTAARISGVLGMLNNIKYFTLKDCANKAIPCLSQLTVDPEKNVRDYVFKALKAFIDKLQEASDDPEKAAKLEKEAEVAEQPTQSGNSAKWAGWMTTGVTSLTSKLYNAKLSAAQPNQPPASSTEKKPAKESEATANKKPEIKSPNLPKPATKPNIVAKSQPLDDAEEENGWDDDGDGWGDMDGTKACNDSGKIKKSRTKLVRLSQIREKEQEMWECLDKDDFEDEINDNLEKVSIKEENKQEEDFNDWDEQIDGGDGWGNDDNSWNDDWDDSIKNQNKAAKKPSNTLNWNKQESNKSTADVENFFDELTANAKPKKAILGKKTTKLTTAKVGANKPKPIKAEKPAETKTNDSWGWDDDWNQNENPNSELTKAERSKLEREEKRKQRKKEIEERRANRAANKLATRKAD